MSQTDNNRCCTRRCLPSSPPAVDARLQPRDTRVTAAFLLLFACVVAGAVFVAVPRGVTVGEISVKTDRMSWNTTKVLVLLAVLVL